MLQIKYFKINFALAVKLSTDSRVEILWSSMKSNLILIKAPLCRRMKGGRGRLGEVNFARSRFLKSSAAAAAGEAGEKLKDPESLRKCQKPGKFKEKYLK